MDFCKLFFYILYKKKVLELRKFSIFGFWWIYILRNVLNTISLFIQNVFLWHKFCDRAGTKIHWQNFVKFYIKFYLKINWCLLDFGTYLSKNSSVLPNFMYLKQNGIGQNCVLMLITLSQSFWNLTHILLITIER